MSRGKLGRTSCKSDLKRNPLDSYRRGLQLGCVDANTMNVTIKVSAFYKCDSLQDHIETAKTFDSMWRETVIGCKILHLLRDMYNFNISYIYDSLQQNVTATGDHMNMSYNSDNNVDVYTRSLSLTSELLEQVYPVSAINTWRFGFLLSRSDTNIFNAFYSKPFSGFVWTCLFGMAFFISMLFYFLKRWEFSVLGGRPSCFTYELLMVIGAYCQHIPPIDSKLQSRRIAYFVFSIFAYIVYTYYASNLLSNLVNDKAQDINLKNLAESKYECVIVDYMMVAITDRMIRYPDIKKGMERMLKSSLLNLKGHTYPNYYNFNTILKKLLSLRPVTIPDGLDAVKKGQVALLSDYTTMYPYIKKTYNNEDICKLASIDLFSTMKKYFITSKTFKYKEQFKIGTLRIKEAGILHRIVSTDFDEPKCAESHLIQICLKQISIPLTVLACTYVMSVLILVAERIHFKRNIVWPYVE